MTHPKDCKWCGDLIYGGTTSPWNPWSITKLALPVGKPGSETTVHYADSI